MYGRFLGVFFPLKINRGLKECILESFITSACQEVKYSGGPMVVLHEACK